MRWLRLSGSSAFFGEAMRPWGVGPRERPWGQEGRAQRSRVHGQ